MLAAPRPVRPDRDRRRRRTTASRSAAFTLGGSFQLAGAMAAAGAANGILYVVLRDAIPARARAPLWSLFAAAVGGSQFVHADGVDFTLLDPLWLAVLGVRRVCPVSRRSSWSCSWSAGSRTTGRRPPLRRLSRSPRSRAPLRSCSRAVGGSRRPRRAPAGTRRSPRRRRPARRARGARDRNGRGGLGDDRRGVRRSSAEPLASRQGLTPPRRESFPVRRDARGSPPTQDREADDHPCGPDGRRYRAEPCGDRRVVEWAVDPGIGSFRDSLWWAIVTVTTVGYGDVVPTSSGGPLVAAVLMLAGVSAIPIATSLVVSVFISRLQRPAARPGRRGAAGSDRPARPHRAGAPVSRIAR